MSTDNGRTWSKPIRVNRTPSNSRLLRQQAFVPSIEVGPGGELVVTYYDFRNDRSDGREATDYWAVLCHPMRTDCRSDASWGVELRLTRQSFNLLNAPVARFKALFRTALFAPVVTTLVAVAVIWRYLFHTSYGLVNWALGHVGIAPVDWLGDPRWAMPTIILFAVWKNFGYNMVIFLAGLQAIPQDLYEAARIDGASRWQQFLHITLPQLGSVLLVVGVITVSDYFQLFAEPYVMTRGDPLQSTVSVLYFMFEEGYKWWNLGRASAVAFLLFLIILGVTTLMLRLGRRKDLV